ncbi:ABC transporter ATP-binding protein [Nonomuraea cavernae]|uniref:ABC transporter ATP-binding protein n=1 Tax=Nonomuraea cavernae TaxID=2045107 RepID=UPI0033DEADBB
MRTPGTAEARGVTQRFGGLTAVSDVSFSVGAGEIHGIIGPNGAGKTTLLNILSGLQRPTSGSVIVGGDDVTRWPSHKLVAKARLVRTFQTVRLFSSMTVHENLMIAARTVAGPAEARTRVDEALDRLALTSLAAERATSLSYGLQRRVELARVMVSDPAVVLLDEPAAGLNPQERRELADTLHAMRDSGVTVVLVEHHMDLVHAVCQHCTVLDFGKVISRGTPDEVTRDPAVLEAYLGGKHHRASEVDAVIPEDLEGTSKS